MNEIIVLNTFRQRFWQWIDEEYIASEGLALNYISNCLNYNVRHSHPEVIHSIVLEIHKTIQIQIHLSLMSPESRFRRRLP